MTFDTFDMLTSFPETAQERSAAAVTPAPAPAPAPSQSESLEPDFQASSNSMPAADPAATPIGESDPLAQPQPQSQLQPQPQLQAEPPMPVLAPAETLKDILARLVQSPCSFDFFIAVRRIESAARPRPGFGQSYRTADEVIRFCQPPSLAFAPSTLASCVLREGLPPRLFVNFFGLCGPNGPLPMHLTEYLHDREHNYADSTPARWFDVFNHRMICLFYRAWAINQQTVSYEYALAQGGMDQRLRAERDRYATYIASLVGIGMPNLRSRDSISDIAKLHYSGRLSNQTKNPEGLAAILSDYFGIHVTIEEFIGEWVTLPHESQCRLGETPETCTLGTTGIVGATIWVCQHRFRIRAGPMEFDQYQLFLPGGARLAKVKDLVRGYIGDELSWELQLVLRAQNIPNVRLGVVGKVGWTTWMGSRAVGADADDLILQPAA